MRRNILPELSSPVSLLDRMFNEWPEVLTVWDREDTIRVEEERQDDAIVIRADLPGVDPEKDVEITVSDGTLRIRAERQQQTTTQDKNLYRSEIRYGSFSRVLPLPAGATEDDVKAMYRDGVLEVRVPVAKAESTSKTVPIAHE